MAILIDSFHIDQFRGIYDLHVDALNHINLFVGDNNCGKTSVLEALQLLRDPSDLTNAFRVARQREGSSGLSLFDNFMYLFPQNGEPYELDVSAKYKEGLLRCYISGERKQILIDPQDMYTLSKATAARARNVSLFDNETEAFQGMLFSCVGEEEQFSPVDINFYTRATGMMIGGRNVLKITYLSPFDHLHSNVINQIVRTDGYKELCLRIIQMFDPQIEDMLILKSNVSVRIVEYLRHKEYGLMPVSAYGDGIKKVLAIANAIAKCAGGILLIDEIETAIHAKYYNDIFVFLVKACKAFGVQAFITTHSIEAVDALLATQEYENQEYSDDINIVTLKKKGQRSYSRVLSGREVQANREAFNFEVRL